MRNESFYMKKIFIVLLTFGVLGIFQANVFAKSINIDKRVEELKNFYSLEKHVEGGYFSEVYTSPFAQNDRATAGSIYFMLVKDDISHFHKIDCDEIWYYHEGGGLRITLINNGEVEEVLLGKDLKKNQKFMVVVPANTIFAAENIDKKSYTFISCATTPKFKYEYFQLVTKAELKSLYPQVSEKILRLAYEKVPQFAMEDSK